MRIADVMTRDVRVVQPDRTVRDAARLMDEMNVGALPVCDGRRLIGMITDRDITVRSTAAGMAPDRHAVREVMTEEVEWCFDDDDVDDIVEVMSRRQIRRIPVVDRSRRLVGIVALGDLATDAEQDAARALHRISEPSEPDRSGTPTTRRADETTSRRPERLSDEERQELERRRSQSSRDDSERGRSGARLRGRSSDEDVGSRRSFSFRDEDDVRAAFGSFGRPGEENVRNARMLGGFGGDGYGNYGDDYADRARFGGYRPRQHGMAGVTGYGERPGDDSSAEEQRLQRLERTYSLVNEQRDHSNYGVGPGNTRFGNDATASRGEVRRDDHTGRGPRNYQRSADRIREDICERLSDDALLDASEIEVKVETRDVTLEGSVRNRAEKRRAEDLAESVPGVGHVQNNLRVGQHQAGSATGSEVGDSGDATGNPGIGTAGTTGGSPPDGRKTGEEIGRRQRQPT